MQSKDPVSLSGTVNVSNPDLARKVSTDRLMTTEEVRLVLGLEKGVLVNWRHKKKGPAYVKLGKSVRYWESDIQRFLEQALIG